MWEKEEDLENAKELVNKFEGRLGAEVRRQEEVEEEKWNAKQNLRVDAFRRMELPGKYMAKLLYRWCNKKFKKEYLNKLERIWNKQKSNKKESEKKYVKKLEESIEQNEINEKMSRII